MLLSSCQYICERVGALEVAEGRPHGFLIYYDEAARRSFNRRSISNDPTFDIEKEVGKISEAILLDAKALFSAAKVRLRLMLQAIQFVILLCVCYIAGWGRSQAGP